MNKISQLRDTLHDSFFCLYFSLQQRLAFESVLSRMERNQVQYLHSMSDMSRKGRDERTFLLGARRRSCLP